MEDKIRTIIAEQLAVEVSAVTLDASFVGDLGADSLDLAELLIVFEQEFDVRIPADKAREIRSVSSAMALIEACQNGQVEPTTSA